MIEKLNLAIKLLENIGEDPAIVTAKYSEAKINELVEAVNRLEKIPTKSVSELAEEDGLEDPLMELIK